LSIVSLSVGGGIVIITVILLGGIIPSSLFTSYSLHMPGMMGTNMNGMQTDNARTDCFRAAGYTDDA